MTAQENFLPKEPLDLPGEPLDLPLPHHSEKTHEAYGEDVKTLLSWKAPGRPFRKRGKDFYISSLLIMLLLEIILFLFSQYMLMLVVLSFVFMVFVLVTVAPHNFRYRISSEGITIEDHFYLWQELYDFYFKKRDTIETVHIRTHALIPGELIIPVQNIEKESLKSTLLYFLPYREVVRQTFMEKSADWLSINFPLERKTS